MSPSQPASRPVRPRLTTAALAGLLLAGAAWGGSCSRKPPPKSEEFIAAPERIGRLEHPRLAESSALAASRKHPGVYWTCNDSDNPPELFALDEKGGSVGVFLVGASRNIDWEAMSIDDQDRLYIGDTGNNEPPRRTLLSLYVVNEPDPRGDARPTAIKQVRFRYPADMGRFDCEAMFVRGQWAYVITKEYEKARLFRVPLGEAETSALEAECLGELPDVSVATDADLSQDGRRLAILSYSAIVIYDLPDAPEKVFSPRVSGRALNVPAEKRFINLNQAEGLCWQAGEDPRELRITNEGRELYRVRVAPPRRTGKD